MVALLSRLPPALVRAVRNGPYVPFLALLVALAMLGAVQAVLDGSRRATVEVVVGPPSGRPAP